MERVIYNQNEKIREDRVGKLLIFIRVGVVSLVKILVSLSLSLCLSHSLPFQISLTMISTGIITLLIGSVDPDILIPHPAFILQLIVLSITPIPVRK